MPPSPHTPVVLPQALRNPHYEQIGGEDAVRRLVERFYQLMDERPQAAVIRAMHAEDLSSAKEKLFLFLSGWLGGPPLYAERYGPPRLRQAHLGFAIDEKARDAWMDCMKLALAEEVADPALRAQLTASFFKTADFLRNQ
ncbi:group II truncated hemoglobin [Methylococcus sp. EFPC2]|uniref:group II truncated hemoglobin n=1 Tax=Methylococcus sp. EFPC2 TaxID=2812648 RepID=UPI001966F6CA|nr:group II truncated hemoglobin [Methylococcus sp. EFPC2]QSA99276.1 group II truncated hemoglobin [Methylococcus sp. EFPC2]